ncbi:MAG: NAD(P)-dependent alcohol dehydrogenase [Acidimicrobiales bacterium]
MKAAIHSRYGPPSVVTIGEVARPEPAPDEILVNVKATTVNRTDSGYRAASPFLTRFFTGLTGPRQPILGTEYAGEVVEAGADVTRFAVGDRVFGYNEGPFGTHAEYLAVAQDASVAAIPDGVGYEQAAPGTEGAHYAYLYLKKAEVGVGSDVLVYGASGAIGTAAVQLAKARGANVTAVCGTDHVDLVSGLGADRVVDYQTSDFTDDDQRYDFVFDAVGKVTYRLCQPLIKPGGRFAATEMGPYAQNFWLVILTRWSKKGRAIFAFPHHNQRMIERFATLMENGHFRPVVDRSYPLDRIVEAYEYVETGQKVGNVVITV